MRNQNLRPAGITPRESMIPALRARLLDLHVLFIQVKIRRALPQSTSLGDSILHLISLVEEIPSLPPPSHANALKKAWSKYGLLRTILSSIDDINAAGKFVTKAAWKIAQRVPAGAADEN